VSSKILPRGEQPASRPAWKRLARDSSRSEESLEPGGDQASEIEQLRRRVRQLEQEILDREARALEQGRRGGYQEGESHASAQAAARMGEECGRILNQSLDSVEKLMRLRVRMRQQMEQDLVRLAMAVARRILHRELHVDTEALQGVVKAAVEKIDARQIHSIRVSPADAAWIERRLSELRLPQRIEVAADPSLPRGGLVMETARGRLDASVETQLQEIERGFADIVGRSG